ncbi:hypothetical protein GGD41_004015 [Paraburkholderia bryophila]|uniref:Uncharacterized protein n=1 Tax=Paraburkholderia bryophila TaxID=420952 RepID=A0A7Y9WA42_9BURK|nr:hypothetical protein [Paraburkholderia bryophila]
MKSGLTADLLPDAADIYEPRNVGAGRNDPAPRAIESPIRGSIATYSRLVLHLDQAATTGYYWPAAGDTTLGLASVLLLFGALLVDVLFVLLGRPEFGAPITLPLSEFGVPGVPYPLFAPFIGFIWFAGLAVLPDDPPLFEPPAA